VVGSQPALINKQDANDQRPRELNAAAVAAGAANMSQGKGGHLHRREDVSCSLSPQQPIDPNTSILTVFLRYARPIIAVQTPAIILSVGSRSSRFSIAFIEDINLFFINHGRLLSFVAIYACPEN